MFDIFLSYSSRDRQRVQPIHDALAEQGFAVFWDQEVPAGSDWDTWLRKNLNEAKCAVVVWSAQSITSDNVGHESPSAKQQGNVFPVVIESLARDQFPMGLYAVQAANLTTWNGDRENGEWQKF